MRRPSSENKKSWGCQLRKKVDSPFVRNLPRAICDGEHCRGEFCGYVNKTTTWAGTLKSIKISRWGWGIMFFSWLCESSLAAQTTRGLLVGVSEYPTLPAKLQLKGPQNDVLLLQSALLAVGVSQQNIVVLADQVDTSQGLPTRTTILRELSRLVSISSSGDIAIIYFSGHGSQQPQSDTALRIRNNYIEPDGLDEIFLPRDIGRWNGKKGVVENAIIDDEFDEIFSALASKGVKVWAIFDTCHAGDMAKSPSANSKGNPVFRMVPPGQLGAPPKQKKVATPSNRTSLSKGDRRDVVSFYATHPHEPAAEESLPDPMFPDNSGTIVLRRYGVFTHALASVMLQSATKTPPTGIGQPVTSFKDLADRVTRAYQPRPFPKPQFDGQLNQSLSGWGAAPATSVLSK
jgi:hypothetical protein